MGCDIHVLTEKFIENKGWFNADNWQYNPYYKDDEYESKMILNEVYDDRDYELFALLADVRNYEEVECISGPKGIPSDCDKITSNYINNWGCDGHSHSYFTIKELYDYWLQMPEKTKRTGVLVGDILEKFDKDGEPPAEWNRGYFGNKKAEWRTWEVEHNPLDNFMTKLIERFCKIFWIFNVKKEEYKIDKRINEAIEKVGDKFRVIFFFDN